MGLKTFWNVNIKKKVKKEKNESIHAKMGKRKHGFVTSLFLVYRFF